MIVLARWGQKNEDSDGADGGGPRGDGIVEWIGNHVQESLELELAYQIIAPVDVPWVNSADADLPGVTQSIVHNYLA